MVESGSRSRRETAAEDRSKASQVGDEAQHAAEYLKGEAGRLAHDARHVVEQSLADQKDAVADNVGGLAQSLRQAADSITSDQEWLGRYVHQAADGLDRVSENIRSKSLGDMVDEVQDFARRQPGLFIGISVVTGFALARFARSSAADIEPHRASGGKAASASRRPQPSRASAASPVYPPGYSGSRGSAEPAGGPGMSTPDHSAFGMADRSAAASITGIGDALSGHPAPGATSLGGVGSPVPDLVPGMVDPSPTGGTIGTDYSSGTDRLGGSGRSRAARPSDKEGKSDVDRS